MSRAILSRYVTPWKFRREQNAQRVRALRVRDGDDCRRCRRPMRFDLPEGHHLGVKVEQMVAEPVGGHEETLDNLCLTHRRCIAEAADNTREVQERIRMKNEAALLSRSRKRVGRGG
jgi:hypothetical protein